VVDEQGSNYDGAQNTKMGSGSADDYGASLPVRARYDTLMRYSMILQLDLVLCSMSF